MASTVQLNETELLMLQQQMSGNVSGLGYTLKSAGVNRADFTGNRQEDIHQHGAIREADATGEIYKIKFYVNYDENTELDRSVLLTVFADGHMTCQTPVLPDLYNQMIQEMSDIRGYSNYLTPFNDLLQPVLDGEFQGKRTRQKERYRGEINGAFIEVIENYFDADEMSKGEKRLYRSILANLGTRLIEEGIPETSAHSDVVSGATLYSESTAVADFFKWYDQYRPQNDINYDDLSNHLNHLLNERQVTWETPVELIDYASNKYGL